jgi:hypothetical protein
MRLRHALAFVLGVVLLLPGGAMAAESFSFGPGSVTYARLRASHGYRVDFSENDKGYFFVRVVGHGSTTDYATKTGRAPDGHLVANFGRRGRFDLRFVPVGKPEPLPRESGCKGPRGSWQGGHLVGRARFRTERGFARFHTHRVGAAEESWPRLVCEFGELPTFGHPKEQRATIAAQAQVGPSGLFAAPERSLTFRATQFYRHAKPADHRVSYVAELRENAHRVTIHRKVVVAAAESSLRFPGAPAMPEEIATKPPAPFSGSAEFLRTPESTFKWGGDLAVAFPGLDPVRLTGPRFGVVICALKGCVISSAEHAKSGG